MGVAETLRILLTIFLSTACIQNVRLFGVYDVRWSFFAKIHTAPLKHFVPSSVLQVVSALHNAPAALAVFLAGVAPVMMIMEGSNMSKTEYDFKALMYSAYVKTHKLCNISGN